MQGTKLKLTSSISAYIINTLMAKCLYKKGKTSKKIKISPHYFLYIFVMLFPTLFSTHMFCFFSSMLILINTENLYWPVVSKEEGPTTNWEHNQSWLSYIWFCRRRSCCVGLCRSTRVHHYSSVFLVKWSM